MRRKGRGAGNAVQVTSIHIEYRQVCGLASRAAEPANRWAMWRVCKLSLVASTYTCHSHDDIREGGVQPVAVDRRLVSSEPAPPVRCSTSSLKST